MEKINYCNNNVIININFEKKEIYMRDLTDVYNETSAYNKKVRGFKKVVEVMEKLKTVEKEDKTTFWGFMSLFDSLGMDMRSYCAVD